VKLRLATISVALLFATTAFAQIDEEEPLARTVTAGKKIRRKGSVKSLLAHKVTIGGRKTLTVKQITDDVFRDHRALSSEMRKNRRALTADASTVDEVIETDDEVVITTSTRFTVANPDALRQSSPRFRRMRSKKGRDGWKLSQLGTKGMKEFKAFKKRVKKLKATHPLRVAAEAGDDALMDALIDGKGDFTVADPDALRKSSPRFRRMRSKKGRDGWKLSQLGSKGMKEFKAFKRRVKKLKATHPLRVAAEAGDDAPMDALIAGKGDFTVEETIIIPKKPMRRDSSGRLMVPTRSKGGNFNYATASASKSTLLKGMAGTDAGTSEDVRSKPETKTAGKSSHTAKFITGFTKADNFIWQKKWKFPSGFLKVKFRAWYEFGLRVPIEIRGTLSPTKITRKGGDTDKPAPFSVDLKAKAVNANTDFYRAVGMNPSLIRDGKEFLMGAGFELVVRLKAGFVVNKTWSIPNKPGFDFSQDFKPPFGDCGTNCGIDIWIPADKTRTKLSLMKIVTGSARIGFKLAGNGKALAKFEALYGDGSVKSWPAGRKNQEARAQTVTFTNKNQVRSFKALAGANARKSTKHYGYSISNPRYQWAMKLIPGVRADIRIKAKPIINDNFPIGPFWLDSLAIDLGTLHLNRHKGTKEKYRVKDGDKTWK
jgi:hypothetical protein